MNIKLNTSLLFFAFVLLFCSCKKQTQHTIENQYLSRTLSFEGGHLNTVKLVNKVSGKEIIPEDNREFQLRISEGTDVENTDVVLSAPDFRLKKILKSNQSELVVLLYNKALGLEIEVCYELSQGNSYLNKFLQIKSSKSITLERVDIEVMKLNDFYQPYSIKQMTALGPAKWRPGLGQPLYTSESATFWGTEFPASYNFVEENTAYCGYLWGKQLVAGETYTSYKSVVGVGDDPNFIQDAFFQYIDKIRIRPLRLQIQYNSWFDFGRNVNSEKFAESVAKVNHELCVKRNVSPLKAFVIDDGWQNARTDWSTKVWQVNTDRFDDNFKNSFETVKNAQSNLGLWLSPGCNFGGHLAVPTLREKGLEALDKWMSLAGPQYMQLLEERMLELSKQGVSYFKLDGLFGHLNRREFDINGGAYGLPTMPQLNTEGLSAGDEKLNDEQYDELKTYYLVAGTERLMEIFQKQHEVNPDIYIVISNGAYLSPWWLQYVDAVWMINAGDAAGGSNRTQELVYRDGVYYNTWVTENTQFPINSVFNHEPKKTDTGESKKQFSEYLWMNLSRGTGFVELYIKTEKLAEADWDVLADGLNWVHKVFPYFKYSRMHGGNPNLEEVYGYTGWNSEGGYASFHNPSESKAQTYIFKLDRANGVNKGLSELTISSPLVNAEEFNGRVISRGQKLEITLEPGEVKILEFKTNK